MDGKISKNTPGKNMRSESKSVEFKSEMVKEEVKSKSEVKEEVKSKPTVNELSLAGATGLNPSSGLVVYFAKTYSEPTETTEPIEAHDIN